MGGGGVGVGSVTGGGGEGVGTTSSRNHTRSVKERAI